jgi:protein O-GlcNAc transferase
MNAKPLSERATALYRAGNLKEAERLYLQILEQEPANFIACYRLGLIRFKQGQHSDALMFLETALKARTDADALTSYGLVLQAVRRFDEAMVNFDKALALAPNAIDALNNRGNLLLELKRFEEALAAFDKALSVKPDSAAILNNRGNALRNLHRIEEALASFDRALAITPDAWMILGNRGNALRSLQRLDEASASFEKALVIKPDNAMLHYNRGNILRELGRFEDALISFDRAAAISPNIPELLTARGNILRTLNRLDEALASFDGALLLNPNYAEAHYNRGNVFCDVEQFAQAVKSYDDAVAIKPNYSEALNNRGNTLWRLGRYDEALESLDKALMIDSLFLGALFNRSVVLQTMGRFLDALAGYDQALAIKPDYVDAINNRGNTLLELKRLDEALESLDEALAINPGFAEALFNRGVVLQGMGRPVDALASYDQALIIKPDYIDAINNRGNALLELKRFDEAGAAFEEALTLQPDNRYALGNLATAVINLCDWRRTAILMDEIGRAIADKKSIIPPFTVMAFSADSVLQSESAKILLQDMLPALPEPLYSRLPADRQSRIRLAYLSSDFHEHATASLLAGLIECHDRASFEIIGISYGIDDRSESRARLVTAFDQFHDVRLKNDLEVAELLSALEVDIAVDLKGYTRGARPGILSHRPCPIQVNYLGYPGTMGALFIDYIIADDTVLPPHLHASFTEKVVLLPNCYQVNDSRRAIPATPARREAGLPEESFVFCCFNNNWKITVSMFDVWMRLLNAMPNSVLWLFEDNSGAKRNLCKEAAARGVDPQRLVFAARVGPKEHLARHLLADLFLDTLPYNAHTTASDALWIGLPLVTCLGASFTGRVAASLLRAIGLPELIANDIDEYEALALKLARDTRLLRSIRFKLEENRLNMPLFDTDLFRRHIEKAYMTMWEKFQQGGPAQAFSVQSTASPAQ